MGYKNTYYLFIRCMKDEVMEDLISFFMKSGYGDLYFRRAYSIFFYRFVHHIKKVNVFSLIRVSISNSCGI